MRADKIIGIILVLFSAFMYSQTLEFPEAVFGTKGAGFFPRILFSLLALAGAVLTTGGFIRDRKRKGGSAAHGKGPEISFRERARKSLRSHSQVLLSFFLVFVYVVIMDYFGYMVATLAFMVALMWYLGPKRPREIPLILVVSCGITFFIYFSFLELLQIFLPEGSLF
jgi:putative tricarboxylic transport membrane protein